MFKGYYMLKILWNRRRELHSHPIPHALFPCNWTESNIFRTPQIKLIMQHCFHVSKCSNSIRITSHESFNQSARLRRLFLAFRAALFPCKKRARCMSKYWASSVTRNNSIHCPTAPCRVDPRYHRELLKVSLWKAAGGQSSIFKTAQSHCTRLLTRFAATVTITRREQNINHLLFFCKSPPECSKRNCWRCMSIMPHTWLLMPIWESKRQIKVIDTFLQCLALLCR